MTTIAETQFVDYYLKNFVFSEEIKEIINKESGDFYHKLTEKDIEYYYYSDLFVGTNSTGRLKNLKTKINKTYKIKIVPPELYTYFSNLKQTLCLKNTLINFKFYYSFKKGYERINYENKLKYIS